MCRVLYAQVREVHALRTFSNYIVTEIARFIDFFHTSSEWFDWTEPSQTTSLQGIQSVQGAFCTSSGRFKRKESHQTFSNYIHTEIERYIDFFQRVRSGSTGLNRLLTTSLQGIQGAKCTSSRGSSTSNLIEPSRTTFSQR